MYRWSNVFCGLRTRGLTDLRTRTGNILRLECFVLCRHTACATVIKQDGHAAAVCTSCVGANNTKLALHETRRQCCEEASLPGRIVKGRKALSYMYFRRLCVQWPEYIRIVRKNSFLHNCKTNLERKTWI